MMKVLKASAGSGKTYNLAKEYIKLLLQDRAREDCRPYRHILAVTFTNKATAEMKGRIVKELDVLGRNPAASPYLAELMAETDLKSPEAVGAECRKALSAILSDYGAFSVSTIDKFFQRVLRAFSRELGQIAQYQVELDKAMLVQETVDRVLDSIDGQKDELLKWLSRCSIETIEEGNGYHLESRLGEFASGYMSEGYRKKVEELGIDTSKAFAEDSIKELKSICNKIIKEFDAGFVKAAEGLCIIAEGCDGLNKNFQKFCLALKSYKSGDELDFTKPTWLNALENFDKLFVKSSQASGSDRLALSGAIAQVQEYAQVYPTVRTARLLRSQVDLFYVADRLDKEFDALLKEKNVLSLEDSNTLLREIISDDNAPFVYEKVGVHYWHFLLDEFQDTSVVQWENFKPLLLNSLASNFYNLIVGDVKQSIYRWRNADWDILDSRVQKELPDVTLQSLDCNWRSAAKIVEFNNGFYKYLSETLDRQLPCRLPQIYSDVQQKAKCGIKAAGYVESWFVAPDCIVPAAVNSVLRASEQGFRWKDVAVIVRSNAMGAEVASALVEVGVPVISNDSLNISSGAVVRALVSCLSVLDDPSDRIGGYFAKGFDPACVKGCQSLCDMAEAILRTFDRAEVNTDTLYVLAFMDLLRDYVARNGNSLHSFLKYWKDEGVGKKISSPEDCDAVTIITIHKVKGLDYPYVVIPFPRKDSFMKSDFKAWECPATEGTGLEGTRKALYYTSLSKSSESTLFAENYRRELRLSYIDAANVWYVATTRASQTMILIAPPPAKSHIVGTASKISDALYDYVDMHFVELPACEGDLGGKRYCFGVEERAATGKGSVEGLQSHQLRYMAPDSGPVAREQVRIKTSSAEFFDTSRRLRGIVLHKIMESVHTPQDLPGSVERARKEGLLDAAQAAESLSMLSEAVAGVSDRGWFAEGADLLDERDILTQDGTYRPDRVVLRDGKVEIIDYKFAQKDASHRTQVQRYAEYYRQMGYSDVKAFLWYIDSGEVEEVL